MQTVWGGEELMRQEAAGGCAPNMKCKHQLGAETAENTCTGGALPGGRAGSRCEGAGSRGCHLSCSQLPCGWDPGPGICLKELADLSQVYSSVGPILTDPVIARR